MLTTLSTIKSRLALDEFNVQFDTILTNAIKAFSTRFERQCNRIFGRTETLEEFTANDTEIRIACYPLDSVSRFELKSTEAEGWIEQTNVEHLIRSRCIITLTSPLGTSHQQGRVIYVGGYTLPGNEVGPGETPLPDDLEQAVVEQVAYWFQTRDQLGLLRVWPHQGTYEQFAQFDLLPSVRAVLNQYARWMV